MIIILGCLEVDMKVSDVSMETTESNNFKGVLENNRDTNGMLAVI